MPRQLERDGWKRLVMAALVAPSIGLLCGYCVHRIARAVIAPGHENHDSVLSWDFGPATAAALLVATGVSALYARRQGVTARGCGQLAAVSAICLPLLVFVVAAALLLVPALLSVE